MDAIRQSVPFEKNLKMDTIMESVGIESISNHLTAGQDPAHMIHRVHQTKAEVKADPEMGGGTKEASS
jgi:hypothetical protein